MTLDPVTLEVIRNALPAVANEMATDLQRSAPRVHFICSACGAEAPKWQGRCPACEAWNSLSEAAVRLTGRGTARVAAAYRGTKWGGASCTAFSLHAICAVCKP